MRSRIVVLLGCMSFVTALASEIKLGVLIEGQDFANCLIHIVIQQGKTVPLDYSSFANPVVNYVVPHYTLFHTPDDLAIAFLAKRDNIHDPSDYMRNLKCILTLVLVDRVPGSLIPLNQIHFPQRFIFPHNTGARSLGAPGLRYNIEPNRTI